MINLSIVHMNTGEISPSSKELGVCTYNSLLQQVTLRFQGRGEGLRGEVCEE